MAIIRSIGLYRDAIIIIQRHTFYHSGNLVLVAETESILGLIQDTLSGTAVNGIVLGAADLVSGGLGTGLLAIRDNAADGLLVGVNGSKDSCSCIPGDLVGGICDTLRDLVGGRLAGIGLHRLLGLWR
jgi:hypothetical protein